MLLIYSLFVLMLFLRLNIVPAVQHVPLASFLKFSILLIASGCVAELLAWTGNYLARRGQPALFHPQLIPDLILAIGFYGGWAVAWTIVLRRYRYSLASVFVTTGLFGIVIEQESTVLLSILQALSTNPLAAVVMAVYVFAVYGAIIGLAYLPVERELCHPQQRHHWLKYPVVLLLLFVVEKVLLVAVALVVTRLGVIPEPRPMWEHPWF